MTCTSRPHKWALGAWTLVPAAVTLVHLATHVPGCVTTLGFLLGLTLGLWFLLGIPLMVWGCIGADSDRAALALVPVAGVLALVLRELPGLLERPLQAFAIRSALADHLEGDAPARAFSADDEDFWHSDVGYLLGGTEDPSGGSVVLDLDGVWWSDGEKHTIPSGRIVSIPMTTCDICRAYPLGEGWWFLWLNN